VELKFSIDGAEELARALRELGPRTANKAGDKALKAGAAPIVARAKELAPKRTGDYAKAITAKLDTRINRRGTGGRVIHIGVLKPKSRILHLLEFGYANVPAQSHFRKAMDTEPQNALNAMSDVLRDTVRTEVRELSR
jgi:HK97 gp10 family phage protein